MQISRCALLAAAVLVCQTSATAVAQVTKEPSTITVPSDAEMRKVLIDRIGAVAGREDGVGIVLGILGPQGRRVVSCGHLDWGDTRQLNGDTVFEIGSVGKVFTALLLADMVQRSEVALADPVGKYLPAFKIPERNGRSITLLDLATPTS